MTTLRRYHGYGLRIASAFPLPLAPDAVRAPADLVLERVATPPRARLIPTEIGPVTVSERGDRVAFAPAPGASSRAITSLLTGKVMVEVLARRGVPCLHATAVGVGKRAVVLAAPSGTGKSTLAAALGRLGCPLLADDVVPIGWREDRAWALATRQGMRLARDAVAHFGLADEAAAADDPRGKFEVGAAGLSLLGGHDARPRPLGRIYFLRRDAASGAAGRVAPTEAFLELARGVFRPQEASPAVARERFDALARLSTRVPCHRLSLGPGLGALGEVARGILRRGIAGGEQSVA